MSAVEPLPGSAACIGDPSQDEARVTRAVRPDPDAAAFFDLDNTIIRGASLYYFARGLAARRYLTLRHLVRFGLRALRFRVIKEHMGDVDSARKAALAFAAGRRVEELQQVGREIFDESMADRVWPGSLAMARQHLDRGERVFVITAAPQLLGEVIAERLGFSDALGTVAEVRDGVYTGNLIGAMLHGQAKADAIRKLAADTGLDLRRCTAYSDSVNDVPMLSLVGHAVAVNPDAALRRHAQEHGWEIRDFRTGRRAAKVAVPVAVSAGVAVGTAASAVAFRRRRRAGKR